jgi:diguanylate cyclase (GGDEF)-like protein
LLRKYDFVARWGGEEFLAVLPETEISGAIVVAERFRKSIESLQIDYKGVQIPVTITLGISQYDSELGVDKSIQLADQALYDGKMNGRNQVVINKKQNNKSEETIL